MKKEKVAVPKVNMFTNLCEHYTGAHCEMEYRFHPVRRWRFDYALPDYKIALEVEGGVWTGGRHNMPLGFLSDIEKYNTATLMGWRVVRVVPKDLYKSSTFDMLSSLIKGDYVPVT